MKCSNCGSEVREGAKFCRECGSEITMVTETLAENKCPGCGNKLKIDAVFCNNCGCKVTNIQTETYTNKCKYCNSPLKKGVKFCRECGKAVADDEQELKQAAPENKKNNGLVFLVILLIIALIASTSVVGYIYFQNNSLNIDAPSIETSVDDDKEDESDEEEVEEEAKITEEMEMEPSLEENENSEQIYLFPSDREYITESDLIGKSMYEVALIRNEIYARHGYIFNTEPYKSYFESQDWYVPNEYFNANIFNEIEKANKDFLVKYEEDRGWR